MLEDIKQKLIEYGRLIWERGFNPGVCGNLSAKQGNKIVITATETFKGFLKLDDFVVIDDNLNILEGSKKYSSETKLHLEFYRQRSDVNCIFHVHSTYLTSFAISNENINLPVLPEIICSYGNIAITDYALPGSKELIETNTPYFKNHNVILMKNHGVIIGGKDMESTYIALETCENYAHKLICAKILGGAKILSDEEIQNIENIKRNK